MVGAGKRRSSTIVRPARRLQVAGSSRACTPFIKAATPAPDLRQRNRPDPQPSNPPVSSPALPSTGKPPKTRHGIREGRCRRRFGPIRDRRGPGDQGVAGADGRVRCRIFSMTGSDKPPAPPRRSEHPTTNGSAVLEPPPRPPPVLSGEQDPPEKVENSAGW
jgi:hypothetical protein